MKFLYSWINKTENIEMHHNILIALINMLKNKPFFDDFTQNCDLEIIKELLPKYLKY